MRKTTQGPYKTAAYVYTEPQNGHGPMGGSSRSPLRVSPIGICQVQEVKGISPRPYHPTNGTIQTHRPNGNGVLTDPEEEAAQQRVMQETALFKALYKQTGMNGIFAAYQLEGRTGLNLDEAMLLVGHVGMRNVRETFRMMDDGLAAEDAVEMLYQGGPLAVLMEQERNRFRIPENVLVSDVPDRDREEYVGREPFRKKFEALPGGIFTSRHTLEELLKLFEQFQERSA